MKQLTATIAKMPAEAVRAAAKPEQKHAARLGLAVSDLTPSEREALDLAGGILVRAVSGPALKAHVVRGDVIVAVNDTKAERLVEFNMVAKPVPGSSLAASRPAGA